MQDPGGAGELFALTLCLKREEQMTEAPPARAPEVEEGAQTEEARAITCPLCDSGKFVKRLLFFTYCANPEHMHKQGDPPTNTVLEFRCCIEHGVKDDCVRTVFEQRHDASLT